LANWSDGEVIRAIREGLHKSGRALIVMPSPVFRQLGDKDVEAIVAYLRSQPAIEPTTPPTSLNILAAFLIGAGLAATSVQPHITQPVLSPPEEISVARGKYLVSIAACSRCHGEQLTGGEGGDPYAPAGPNLRAILTKWNVEDFTRTIRTGIDPYNHTLAEGMPWKEISAFATDTDLGAIYTYLHGLPLIPGAAD
jgi:cytochrome c553